VNPSEFPGLPFAPAPMSQPRTGSASLPVLQENGTSAVETITSGVPIYTLSTYENAGEIHVAGIDVDMGAGLDFGQFGRVSASIDYSHEFLWDMSNCDAGTCGTIYLAGTHGPTGISGDTGNPKDRAVAELSWEKGALRLSWTVNYTGHFSLTDPSSLVEACAQAIASSFGSSKFANGAFPSQYCTVSHFTDVNLTGSYSVTRQLTAYVSVQNLFNSSPPVDMQTYSGVPLAYNSSFALEGAVGTLIVAGAQYRF
jgi:iron complex outermembrane recepter protein